jgi:hypothetical protein
MQEASQDTIVVLLKRLPAIAEERNVLARSLRHLRRMEPKIARLLLRIERARRSDVARRWLRETAPPEPDPTGYIRWAVLELQLGRHP